MKGKKQQEPLLVETEERYRKFEISPTSQFFLYGKGSNDDYFGEVRRVKNELRELAYGNVYNYNKEIETVAKKRRNVVSAVVLATAIAALIIAVLGIVFKEAWFLTATSASLIDVIKPLFSGSTEPTVTAAAVTGAITLFMTVAVFIGAVASLKKPFTGKIMKTGCFVWLLSEILLWIFVTASGTLSEVGLHFAMLFAFVATIAAAAGRKKIKTEGNQGGRFLRSR